MSDAAGRLLCRLAEVGAGVGGDLQVDVVDRRHILCATHGALFRIEDGHCLAGPCKGKGLTAVAVAVAGGEVRLVGEDYPQRHRDTEKRKGGESARYSPCVIPAKAGRWIHI